MILKDILKNFEKLKFKIRGKLSHYPILYAFIGGTGIVLFWRGIWHIADDIEVSSFLSLVLGTVILLITGVFVAEFIGTKLIIAGLVGEKKLSEREEGAIETEETQLKNLQNTLNKLEKKLDHIDEDIEKK